MNYGNRFFNVNGKGDNYLLDALKLAFAQNGTKVCKAWSYDQKRGLVLHWWKDGSQDVLPLPAEMTPEQLLPLVVAWLDGTEAKNVHLEKGEIDFEHDGSNSKGWRVFYDERGNHTEICVVKPVFLWHGK